MRYWLNKSQRLEASNINCTCAMKLFHAAEEHKVGEEVHHHCGQTREKSLFLGMSAGTKRVLGKVTSQGDPIINS